TIPLFILLAVCLNALATTDISTLSLHDALPIYSGPREARAPRSNQLRVGSDAGSIRDRYGSRRWPGHVERAMAGRFCGRYREDRSEEHTSELQSRENLVCRLLLEKKKQIL